MNAYAFIFGWGALTALPAVVALVRRRPRLALGIALVGPSTVLGVPFLLAMAVQRTDPSYGERAMVFLMEPYIAAAFLVLAAVLAFGLPTRASTLAN